MIARHSNRELWLAFIAAVAIALIYLYIVVSWKEIPGASAFFGHSLGILGFILMLMTETLYSARKRSSNARLGKMSDWLQFHIFTGLVGPFLVLLHTSWKFNGLAGVLTLLTAVLVASGFVGRYIYTAVPRTADGIEYEAMEIEVGINTLQSEIDQWLKQQSAENRALARRLLGSMTASMNIPVVGQLVRLVDRITWWLQSSRLDPVLRQALTELRSSLMRRDALNIQLKNLATARKLLSVWHTVHIPIGMAVFTAAFIHIVAAIYYATLLK